MVSLSLIINQPINEADLKIICSNKNINLIGIIDKNYFISEKLIKKFNLKRYSDYNYIIQDTEAFFFTSSTTIDFKLIIHIIKQSKHIFFYQYPNLSRREIKEIIKTAHEANISIQLFHPDICSNAYQASIKQIINPLFIEFNRKEKFNKKTKLSTITDFLIYDISLIKYLVPTGIKKIKSNCFNVLKKEKDFVYVFTEFDNGCLASLIINTLSANKKQTLSIHEIGRTVDIDLINDNASILRKQISKNGKNEKISMSKLKSTNYTPLDYKLKCFIKNIKHNNNSLSEIEDYLNTISLITNITEN